MYSRKYGYWNTAQVYSPPGVSVCSVVTNLDDVCQSGLTNGLRTHDDAPSDLPNGQTFKLVSSVSIINPPLFKYRECVFVLWDSSRSHALSLSLSAALPPSGVEGSLLWLRSRTVRALLTSLVQVFMIHIRSHHRLLGLAFQSFDCKLTNVDKCPYWRFDDPVVVIKTAVALK